MKTELIRIGNSRGVRIPKPLIEQVGLGNSVDLRVEDDHIVIAKERKAREGWEHAFQAAGSAEDDELLLDVGANEFDQKQWKW
jgi:antitoxin MazE